jgi:hypothetical protein
MQIHRASCQFHPRKVDSTFLWHFMPIDSLHKLETFLKGGLWFARLDTFGSANETREGKLPRCNLGLLEKMPRFMVEWVEKQYDLAVFRSYASCWSKGDRDPSEDFWHTNFGGYGNGIAICTMPDLVSSAIAGITSSDNTGPAYFGSVDYIDHDRGLIPEGNTLEAAFIIRSEYSAENEARVLIHSYGPNAVQYLLNTSGPYGPLVSHHPGSQSSSGEREFDGGHLDGKAIVVHIDKEQFIYAILFGPNVNEIDRTRITNLIGSYGLASKIRDQTVSTGS